MSNEQNISTKQETQNHLATNVTRRNRTTLTPFFRLLVIASWGVFLACLISYGLTKIGY